MEEYAYILDYLPQGSNLSKKEAICYAVGDDEFKLFELVPKADAIIGLEDRVYIGKDANLRKEIDHVKRRVGYEDLTNTAVKTLEYIVKVIVNANQERFIKFYNESQQIAPKKHMLEELPGLGKKTMMDVLMARRAGSFKDFEDLKARVPTLKDPAKLIADRIILEISDNERRRYLFIVK